MAQLIIGDVDAIAVDSLAIGVMLLDAAGRPGKKEPQDPGVYHTLIMPLTTAVW